MKYVFGQRVQIVNQFYAGHAGYIIKYETDPDRIPEQRTRYAVRFTGFIEPIDRWFWEDEIRSGGLGQWL